MALLNACSKVFITRQDVEQLASGYVDIPPYYASSSPYSLKRTANLGKQTVDLRRSNQAFQNAPKQGERSLEQRLARLLPSPQTVYETPQKTIQNRVNVSDRMRLEIIRLAQMGMSRRKIKEKGNG